LFVNVNREVDDPAAHFHLLVLRFAVPDAGRSVWPS
jgi:hypothetical protein